MIGTARGPTVNRISPGVHNPNPGFGAHKSGRGDFLFFPTLNTIISKSTCPEAFVDELAGRSTIGD